MPRNLAWRSALLRLALLNELMVVVGAVSMHALGLLGNRTAADPGLAYHVIWMHCIGLSALALMGVPSIWVVRRAWSRLPDAQKRYESAGAYLGLPWPDRTKLALSTLVGGMAAAGFAWWAMTRCAPWLTAFGPAPTPPLKLAVFNTAYGSLAIYVFEYFRDRATWSRHRERRARQLGAQAQLELLRAQLEPHMLFNTLANVNDLIDEDPARAKAMLHRLNDFLRATLFGSRAIQHGLQEEFGLVADYLALMQMRMGDRLEIELDLPTELASKEVPAMLLQPLVENAIQHGIAPRRAGGRLRVSATRSADALRLTVHSTGGSASVATRGQGLGLKLVRERLQALHGQAAHLQLTHQCDQDTTLATVTLPL